jgi:hypothetical protein
MKIINIIAITFVFLSQISLAQETKFKFVPVDGKPIFDFDYSLEYEESGKNEETNQYGLSTRDANILKSKRPKRSARACDRNLNHKKGSIDLLNQDVNFVLNGDRKGKAHVKLGEEGYEGLELTIDHGCNKAIYGSHKISKTTSFTADNSGNIGLKINIPLYGQSSNR